MKPLQRRISWLALAAIAGLLWWLWPSGSQVPPDLGNGPSRSLRAVERLPTSPAKSSREDAPRPDPAHLIEYALAGLLAAEDSKQSTAVVANLRDALRLADQPAAASAIAEFLQTGRDAPTRLPFAVGPGGTMSASPTLRTTLLDLLPSLDPGIALGLAREIMDQKKSPDEYALALRNLAWNDLNGDLQAELSERLEQMIESAAWRKNPSPGFLEALDAAVEIMDEKTFGKMLTLSAEAAKDQNTTLARASFIALDRMVLREPGLLEKSYRSDPQLSGISPDQRASLMSRLDLDEPNQRELFSQYLADPEKGPGELDYFAEVFPNGNYLHGNWLITTLDPTHSISSRMQADQKTLQQIRGLLANNSDKQPNKTLVQIQDRLEKFIATVPKK